MRLKNTLSNVAQGRSPDFILQAMKIADRVSMPKTLACCERYVAIDPAKSMRTQAVWEHIPACSSVRITKGLDAARKETEAHATSKQQYLVDILVDAADRHPRDAAHHMRLCMNGAQNRRNLAKPKTFVPTCKAFLQMAERSLSQQMQS